MEDSPLVSDDSNVQICKSNDDGQLNNKTTTTTTTTTTTNVVIDLDLNDDELNHDQDCIFLKRKKNLTPRNIKSEKKLGKEIRSDLVQCVDDYDDDNDEIRIVSVKPPSTPKRSSANNKKRKLFSVPSVFEVGESSRSKSKNKIEVEVVEIAPDPDPAVRRMFNCDICADSKPLYESFNIKGCSHSYCFDCIKNYVASKLQDGVSQINCPVPRCHGLLEPEYCREILPFEVFDRWGKLLCESVILASQKFYCPFKDCSALLLDDGKEVVAQSECPSCFRLFCAQCKVAWHHGIECAEYQKLGNDEREKEDIMLRNLAKQKLWKRCPKCNFYVEKVSGCAAMRCRCGTSFCYNCGGAYTYSYGGATYTYTGGTYTYPRAYAYTGAANTYSISRCRCYGYSY